MATAAPLARLSALPQSSIDEESPRSSLETLEWPSLSNGSDQDDLGASLSANAALGPGALTPPTTPARAHEQLSKCTSTSPLEFLTFDFANIDYELERARTLGSGLWSCVYLAGPILKPVNLAKIPLSPPNRPPRPINQPSASVYAVKVPTRPDALPVLREEAKILSHLQRQSGANQYMVGFYGLDERNSALVFEAVIGGSLQNLISRLKVMTELARHLELISIFPGLARDLVGGLDFLHRAGIVHADIKAANVLLDISDHYSLPKPVIRARYIDFSASFHLGQAPANAGGTWDYMAPEQMRSAADMNTPTFASDVWSLGITMLTVIVGGSPYAEACGGNNFMLREAIKSGDPLSFASMDPVVHKRMAACQDFVDCCRLALHKDRARRTTATAWMVWLGRRDL